MPQPQKLMGALQVLTGKMWGLEECKFFDDNKALGPCPHSGHTDNMPSFPSSLEFSEEPYDYRPGGLHPIHIDDLLENGRYKVIHKLGYGSSSTVWLARDVLLNSYVAIKILTAEASKIGNELGCLKFLSAMPRSKHPGQKYISASFLDRHFWFDGPNGYHLALVSKVSGPSIAQMSGWLIRLREFLARKIARQVTQGLAYLHSEGISHGNLTSSDVLFQLTNFDAWSQEEVYEQLGIPTVVDLPETWSRGPSSPRYLVDSAQFFRASPRVFTYNIRIIDYGDSFRNNYRSDLCMKQGKLSNGFCAPEILCGLKGGPSTDLWALGCIIYEIRAGCHLFPFSIGVSPLDVISEIVQVLGSLPYHLSHSMFDDHGFPDPDGEKIVPEQPVGDPLSQVVAEIEVERGVNLEPSMTETRQKNLTTFRNYINLDPHHFWIPAPKRGTTLVESLILSHEERAHELKLGKTEKPLPKISSTEAKHLLNLLSRLLRYLPGERNSAANLAEHPWFTQAEDSSRGESSTGIW